MLKLFAYMLRWQISGLVMMPILHYCANLGIIFSVVVSQFIGSLLFFFVDKRIFKGKEEKKVIVDIGEFKE